MPRTPRIAGALLATAALVATFAGPAFADSNTYCIELPAVYTAGVPKTPDVSLCVPWPL
ncbi:MAG TPA: hypothetical protein VGX28_14185 [Frankiaceae bacterium]|nr:hypothetical protein [Frankiaceae bacterium]